MELSSLDVCLTQAQKNPSGATQGALIPQGGREICQGFLGAETSLTKVL